MITFSARIEELDMVEVLDLLHSLGGWPTLGDKHGGRWNETTFDLVTDLVQMRKYGNAPLVHMYISTDDKNVTKRIVRVSSCLRFFSQHF